MKKNLPGKLDKALSLKNKKKLKMDWEERPEFICPDCGYHKKSCVCKLQSINVEDILSVETSIDFY